MCGPSPPGSCEKEKGKRGGGGGEGGEGGEGGGGGEGGRREAEGREGRRESEKEGGEMSPEVLSVSVKGCLGCSILGRVRLPSRLDCSCQWPYLWVPKLEERCL